MPSNDDYYDPCENCPSQDTCDGWEARFCCTRCRAFGLEDCDNCDSWDI